MSYLAAEPASEDHHRAVQMLSYCLVLDSSDTWLGAIHVFRARLTSPELAALAFVTLRALGWDGASKIVEAVQGRPGTPLPPFLSAMDEASFWADLADPEYIKACVLAGFEQMSPQDQAAFLDYAQGRKAA